MPFCVVHITRGASAGKINSSQAKKSARNVNRAKGELTPGKSPGGFEGLEEENIRQLPPRGYGEFEKIKKSFVLLDFLFL